MTIVFSGSFGITLPFFFMYILLFIEAAQQLHYLIIILCLNVISIFIFSISKNKLADWLSGCLFYSTMWAIIISQIKFRYDWLELIPFTIMTITYPIYMINKPKTKNNQ